MNGPPKALEELFESLGDCLTAETAERLAALRAPASVQARLDELARKSSEGRLSPEEREECDALISAGTFISILKSKGRQLLKAEKRRS